MNYPMQNEVLDKPETPLEIIESFSAHFDVELILAQYAEWDTTTRPHLKAEIERKQGRLDVGGLERKLRKQIVISRNKLQHDLRVTDPRRFGTDKFDIWLYDTGLAEPAMSNADISELRAKMRSSMFAAVKNTEEYSNAGLPPFVVDFEGSSVYFMIKTIVDYTRDAITNHGSKTEGSLGNKKLFLQSNLDLIEFYGNVPEDLKLMSNLFIEHSLEFSMRVARLQDEMLRNTLLSLDRQNAGLLVELTPKKDQRLTDEGNDIK